MDGQHQHRDELLAGGGDEPVRVHEPLFDLIDDWPSAGARRRRPTTARAAGCCTTTPTCGAARRRSTHSNHGIWPTGGRLALPAPVGALPVHAATGSSCAQRAYPLMKAAALFFVDFLVKDPEDRLADQRARPTRRSRAAW